MRIKTHLLLIYLFCLSGCEFIWNGLFPLPDPKPNIPVNIFVGSEETGHVDGLLTQARFHNIRDMAIDSEGNVFVLDGGNSAIRKVTPEGKVSSIASIRQWWKEAGINYPKDRLVGGSNIAIDSKDNVFVSYTTCIRKLEKQGDEYIVSTFVGTCYDQRSNVEVGITNPYEYENYDAELTTAPELGFLNGLAIDQQDNLYAMGPLLLRISPDKQVTVLKNAGGKPFDGYFSQIRIGPDNRLYIQPTLDRERPVSNIFVLDESSQSLKTAVPAPEHSLPHYFTSFSINAQGYFYLIGGANHSTDDLAPWEEGHRMLQHVSPEGKHIQAWPLPFNISFENAVLDEKRRVIYTGSTSGRFVSVGSWCSNCIYKIPLPDGA